MLCLYNNALGIVLLYIVCITGCTFFINNCRGIPGLTIIFDADPFLLSERNSNKNLDRMEVEGIEFQKQVRAGYLDIAKNNNRCHVVYCKNRSIEDIHLEVKSLIINNILKDKK